MDFACGLPRRPEGTKASGLKQAERMRESELRKLLKGAAGPTPLPDDLCLRLEEVLKDKALRGDVDGADQPYALPALLRKRLERQLKAAERSRRSYRRRQLAMGFVAAVVFLSLGGVALVARFDAPGFQAGKLLPGKPPVTPRPSAPGKAKVTSSPKPRQTKTPGTPTPTVLPTPTTEIPKPSDALPLLGPTTFCDESKSGLQSGWVTIRPATDSAGGGGVDATPSAGPSAEAAATENNVDIELHLRGVARKSASYTVWIVDGTDSLYQCGKAVSLETVQTDDEGNADDEFWFSAEAGEHRFLVVVCPEEDTVYCSDGYVSEQATISTS